jgi:hypothetical protein
MFFLLQRNGIVFLFILDYVRFEIYPSHLAIIFEHHNLLCFNKETLNVKTRALP